MAAASDETRRDGKPSVEVTEVDETGDEIVAHVVDLSAVTFMDTLTAAGLLELLDEVSQPGAV
jgi:anti-anti-sigma regulatory factor